MANSRHYYKGIQIEEPEGWQNMEVTITFGDGRTEISINNDNLVFKGDDAKKIIDDFAINGYFEAREYRIEIGELLNPALTYNGILNPSKSPTFIDCNQIQIPLERKQGNDWLIEVAESFSYRFLASSDYNGRGSISDSDYIKVPYIINYIPDGMQLLFLAISTFMLTKELVESVKSVATQTVDLIKQVVPNVGTSVGLGAGVVTSWSIGQVVGAIVNLAVTIAYTVGIIVGLVELTKQIIEQLAPVKRFHKGMSIKSLVVKSCEYLGLTYKSTLIDELDKSSNRWVVIPRKFHKGGVPSTGILFSEFKETGVPDSGDGIDNFGQLINVLKTTFNGDFIIEDGVFQFERWDYWKDKGTYTIPNTFVDQEKLLNPHKKNTDSLKSNYVISWETDLEDKNTLDVKDGLVYQVITTQKTISNPDLSTLKGLENVNVPFSMAVRKDKLTAIEEVLKVFLQAADFLSGQLDQPNSFAAQFSARIGSMHLSSHKITKPKMVIMSGASLAKDQRQKMSASRLWSDYHYINSFVTQSDGSNNQQLIYEEQKIDFCFENFVSLGDNPYQKTEDGRDAKIKEIVWNYESNTAVITYNVFSVYDNNLKETFLD